MRWARFLDLNTAHEQVAIDWNTDTRDKGDHLNYFGAQKATNVLGAYLADTGLLPSHKDDPALAADWNTQSDAFSRTVTDALAKT